MVADACSAAIDALVPLAKESSKCLIPHRCGMIILRGRAHRWSRRRSSCNCFLCGLAHLWSLFISYFGGRVHGWSHRCRFGNCLFGNHAHRMEAPPQPLHELLTRPCSQVEAPHLPRALRFQPRILGIAFSASRILGSPHSRHWYF